MALHDGKPALNLTYDRNACSAARAQEVVQVLATLPSGMRLARTRYALGFLDADAPLSPPLPAAQHEAFVRGPRAFAPRELALAGEGGQQLALDAHASVPLLPSGAALIATTGGVVQSTPDSAKQLTPARRALTRRALLSSAFTLMGAPYGFGDAGGGRDCSRLTMDVFESFDLALPRHSGWQAQAGRYNVDVTGASDADKLSALDAAQATGAVLLAFPGHIMLYLGRDDAGTPRVLHALGEYASPCAGGGETIMAVERTMVSGLELGRGSSRRSLLERVTALVVLGAPPPAQLAARAKVHPLPPLVAPPAESACSDSNDARIFASPARPVAGQPLRLIATTGKPVRAPALFVYAADGSLVASEPHHLGGPPFTAWNLVPAAESGRYTALFVDGTTTLGCKRVAVRSGEIKIPPVAEGPVWTPTFKWETDTLNLWAAFVEQLFDDPPDDERTWTNLHSLLRDPERNLLLDHLGIGEDARLAIEPDCADLPYSLRAYFAWKLRLPFAFRQCSRGRPGVPPKCGPLHENLIPREAADELDAFSIFVNRRVRAGVHSATGRTGPDDDETDLYPVALERAALAPGTVYADPYGHVLMVTKWFAQGRGADDYGILIAAEAQPDGTIGRRRFFPGSFLFDPSTTDAGAGFKAMRPLIAERTPGAPQHLVALDNASLAKSDVFPRFSKQQYAGSKDDFYDAVDRLINPAPLDPHARMMSLVEALDEAARRRVLAIDNGEQYMNSPGHGAMPMPTGHDVFETTGPWEDFATPSRDMRLLIAIDTVLALPARLRKSPERFKLADPKLAGAAAQELTGALDAELARRSFEYTRSDGSKQRITLKDVVARSAAIEVGYNPNDCVEQRWGAAPGSPEAAPCKRHAPAEQQQRMERYREWFHERKRPPRNSGN
ncbi:MAG TPA: NlpC/P60 family protein, partial [Polyangiales bacterium]|nr:NlpC/P60 family protein [Polyangiales bacterium]